MWEDMSDGSQRIFCQLPDSWLTQCGKTSVTAASESIVSCPTQGWLMLTQCGKTSVTAASESIVSCPTQGWLMLTQCGKTWVTAASESFVSCSTHEWLNVGSLESRRPIHKSSWHVSILPHCGKKCDKLHQDFDHSDSFKNVHGCLCCVVVRSVCCNCIFLSKLVFHSSSKKHICKSRHVHDASSLGHLSQV